MVVIIAVSLLLLFILKDRFENLIKIFMISICIILCVVNVSKAYKGYKYVSYSQNYNIKAIEEYRANGSTGILTFKTSTRNYTWT